MADNSGRLNQVFSETSFLYGGNAAFIEGLHERWAQDPNSVSPAWRAFFEQLRDSADSVKQAAHAGSWGRAPQIAAPRPSALDGDWPAATVGKVAKAVQEKKPGATEADIRAAAQSIRALMLIRTYRIRGHLQANLDPLGIEPPIQNRELEPEHYGFTEADMDREIYIDGVLGLQAATLRALLALVRRTYAGKMGVQYMHIDNPEERAWLQQRMEPAANQMVHRSGGQEARFAGDCARRPFEAFLDNRFKGHKRFSLEGGETMTAIIEELLERAAAAGVREVFIGMAHRGRLTLLANIIGKGIAQMFSEFEGDVDPETNDGQGDVKYHLGASSTRDHVQRPRDVHLSLPPIRATSKRSTRWCEGSVRPSRIAGRRPNAQQRVIPLLIHGDAAFAGQGVVAETLNLCADSKAITPAARCTW